MTRVHDESTSEVKTLLRHGLVRSFSSLAIKIATAGLTYLMFVILSRAMSPFEYGLFAFGFALATVLSIGASMGQQTAILRFWPEDTGHGDTEAALTDIRAGWVLTLMSGTAIGLCLVVIAALFGLISGNPGSQVHIMAAALLILPMGAADYASSALRAQGSVWTALAPRDILWRLLVPIVAVGLFYLFGVTMSGPVALGLTAALLVLCLLAQAQAARIRGYRNEIGFSGLAGYWRARGRSSLWFLFSAVIDSATLNLDIVLVGLLLTAEAAGLYFNAFRTAGLLTLFLFALVLVIAPLISRYYHGGDIKKVQRIATLSAWGGFIFSLGVFALFVFYGDFVMSLFGHHYAEGQLVLVLLSLGLLVDAATGPTRIIMMMTGYERTYAKIMGSISLIGLGIQILIIPFFGVIGAAAVNAATRATAQIAIAIWTRRHIGVGPTIFGTLLPPAGTPHAATPTPRT